MSPSASYTTGDLFSTEPALAPEATPDDARSLYERPCTPPAAEQPFQSTAIDSPGSSSTSPRVLKRTRLGKRTSVTFSEDMSEAFYERDVYYNDNDEMNGARGKATTRFQGNGRAVQVSGRSIDDHFDTGDAPLRWRPRPASHHGIHDDPVPVERRTPPLISGSSSRSMTSSQFSRLTGSPRSPLASTKAAGSGVWGTVQTSSPRRQSRFTDLRSPEEKARQESAKGVHSSSSWSTTSPATTGTAQHALTHLNNGSRPNSLLSTPSRAPLAYIRSSLLAERSPLPGPIRRIQEEPSREAWTNQALVQTHPDGYASPPLSRQTSPSHPLQRRASDGNLPALVWASNINGEPSRGHVRTRSNTSIGSFRASPRTKLLRTVDDMSRELQFTREGMVKLATRLERLEQGTMQQTTHLWETFEKQLEGTLLLQDDEQEATPEGSWWQASGRITQIAWVLGLILLLLLLVEWLAVVAIREFSKRMLCVPS